ncbi:MAG: endonuclease III [Ignavibacteria bacterium RBG_16_34_14]|nr:MAG: endonuclease III [Ignavibacteria bacterium RBG_16_34_14]
MKNKTLLIDKLLIKKFGVPERSINPPDLVDLLIATILSQNTNDRNSFKAYNNLKQKYSAWEEAAKLKASQIEKLIKVAGLGKQKSKAIKNLLISLIKERGNISLNHLKKMNDEEVLTELTSYPGIGVKTASCVLLFSLNRNVCPVDTHVHRTLNRIGIVKTTSPDKTFFGINKNFPEGIAHSFHTNLIRLGREICKPIKPLCLNCPLNKVCKYENKMYDKPNSYKENSFMLLDNV